MGSTVDKYLVFIRESLGPVDQCFLGDADIVHLAAPGVVVVHQKADVRCGDDQGVLRAPEESSHDPGLSVSIVAAL